MRLTLLCLSLLIISCKKQIKLIKVTDSGVVTTETNGQIQLLEGLDNQAATTFIFVRHAEKILDGEDPSLTEEGKHRANKLAEMLSTAGVHRVAHTNTKRSQETAQSLIKMTNCGVDVYSKQVWEAYFANSIDAYRGKKIVVIGHSNTIHTMLNSIINEEKYKEIDEKDYENIYIVSVIQKGNARVSHYKF